VRVVRRRPIGKEVHMKTTHLMAVRALIKAGDVLFIPAGTIHAARYVGRGNSAALATYVVGKGKPLVTLVK
jgi:quercetin dioxygenase-like cupin family protein